jgi:Ser/Thr protein kinase RdoA (MazF antagonist)
LTETFPVIHSILDAEALGHAVAERYGVVPVHCQLISRGSNDIYRLRTRLATFAVRVVRAGWRDHEQLTYELEWANFLVKEGLPVPGVVQASDGSLYFSVVAPEGSRSVVVIQWFEGAILTTAVDEATAGRVGQLLATIHQAATRFEPTYTREVDTVGKIVRYRNTLAEMLGHLPEQQRFFDAAMDWLAVRINEVKLNSPKLHTHGDVHLGNVIENDEGELCIIDFDDGGYDYAVKDLMPFLWRNSIEGVPESVTESFLAGYEHVRQLNADEKEEFSLFLAARHVYLLASYSAQINKMGPVPGFDAGLEHYLDLARKALADAGFDL